MSDPQVAASINQLNQDLRRSLKEKDKIRLSVLRSLLTRISNAEAVQVVASSDQVDGPIAGATPGVGSSEVARKQLSMEDLQTSIEAELSEVTTVLDQLNSDGSYAEELRLRISILKEYSSSLA